MTSGDSLADRQARYQQWKDRLAQTKAEQRVVNSTSEASAPAQPEASYWSAESLFRDAELEAERERLAAEAERQRSERAAELLALLGLPPTADLAAASARYKQLAKELHPDRLDKAEDRAAARKLVEYSAAYGELKGLLR